MKQALCVSFNSVYDIAKPLYNYPCILVPNELKYMLSIFIDDSGIICAYPLLNVAIVFINFCL